jgi:hypothetical protein
MRKTTALRSDDAVPHPSLWMALDLQEHQKDQKHIEDAHQSQYGTTVDIHACYLSYLSLYHGNTSLSLIISQCPARQKRIAFQDPREPLRALTIGLSKEKQNDQKTIEYAHQSPYGDPAEGQYSDLRSYSVDHGHISSPPVVY